jgi:hypothetical protein
LKFGFHLLQLGLHSLALRLPQYRKLSVPCLAADVDKTEKGERLRFPLSALPPSLGRISTEFQQTRFLGIQFQAELLHTLLQFFPELFGSRFLLKAHHTIVRVPYEDDILAGSFPSPCLDPQIQRVMEIDVGQQW